jgi:prolyl-tRNA synthetase
VAPLLITAMNQMKSDLLAAALARREAATLRGATKAQFIDKMEREGGFVYGGFCGSPECEAEIKDQTKATIRVLPDEEFRSPTPPTKCMWCGRPSVVEAVWAKAY